MLSGIRPVRTITPSAAPVTSCSASAVSRSAFPLRASDDNTDAVFFQRILDPRNDLRVREGGDVGQHNKDLTSLARSQAPGVVIGNVAIGLRDLANSLAGLFCNCFRTRQCSAHRGRIDASQSRDVDDRDRRCGPFF